MGTSIFAEGTIDQKENAMTEKNEINRLLLDLPSNMRLFRNNVGTAWAGVIVAKTSSTITLREARPLHAGLCVGSSDLIGWTTVEITEDMVGDKVAVFTAIEVKAGNTKTTDAQANFVDQVNNAGGFASIKRIKE